MKSHTQYITKSQLVTDYVTKRELNDFRDEISDFKEDIHAFREETRVRFNSIDARLNGHDTRFDSHDKRFDSLDRKIDALREEMNVSMGVWRDQLRADFIVGIEYMKDMIGGKKNLRDKIFG